MRKFADKQRTIKQSSNQAIKQTNGSNTEATLILCGSSGERKKKNEKICPEQTIKQTDKQTNK